MEIFIHNACKIGKTTVVKMMIVSNAVGGLNPRYKVGDLMLVKDHINFLGLAGDSPLRGPNDTGFGPRFFSINNLYDQKWRRMALEVAKEVSHTILVLRIKLSVDVLINLDWYRGHSARGGPHHVRGPQLRECGRAEDVLSAGG